MSEQKKKGTKTFVLNDESITNDYGFRVSNKGLNLERFKANPIMLSGHIWSNIIGKWTNIRIEGTKLLADADFDLDDLEAEKLAGKVERGYLNGVSLGFRRDRTPLNLNADGYIPHGEAPLFGGEVYEASVLGVPSNSGALSIKLYAKAGSPLSSEEITSLSASYKTEKPMNEQEKQDYERRIQELTSENTNLKEKEKTTLKASIETRLTAMKNLSPEQKENLMEIGMSLGMDKLETTLSALNPAVSLNAMTQNNGSGGEQKPKTYTELCAMGKDKLDFYMQNDPEFVNQLISKS